MNYFLIVLLCCLAYAVVGCVVCWSTVRYGDETDEMFASSYVALWPLLLLMLAFSGLAHVFVAIHDVMIGPLVRHAVSRRDEASKKKKGVT
jgi:hypothetical protein